jgi:hypothetical protein
MSTLDEVRTAEKRLKELVERLKGADARRRQSNCATQARDRRLGRRNSRVLRVVLEEFIDG